MGRIKVLYIVESMEVAGAERVVLSLITGLNKARFEPVVCCLTEKGALAGKLEEQNVPVIALGKDPEFDWPVIPKLMKVIRQQRVDIVHTHSWPANFWGRVAARLAGTPVILATEHSVHTWKNRMHLILDYWLAKITDRVICCSDAVQQFYREKAGIDPDKLVRIYNGIDLAPFDTGTESKLKRQELGIPADQPVVIVVGRLLPEKGHQYFLEALAQVKQSFPSLLTLIVGSGPAQNEIDLRITELNLQNHVRLLGERSDVPELMRISDLFVLPSLREGLPLVVLEAMAAARPVVVTDVGGNREVVVEGKTGLIVPARDAAALASAAMRLLINKPLAASMGQSGHERVAKLFSLDTMVRANENLYKSLMESK